MRFHLRRQQMSGIAIGRVQAQHADEQIRGGTTLDGVLSNACKEAV
jgi:hypothetical protein